MVYTGSHSVASDGCSALPEFLVAITETQSDLFMQNQEFIWLDSSEVLACSSFKHDYI